ncbi:MAG: hypothetical protein KF861_22255, partial [Planctomycetaceae bacterium]|nr:hypothetical protein [Planctomycetaceae bacterium]
RLDGGLDRLPLPEAAMPPPAVVAAEQIPAARVAINDVPMTAVAEIEPNDTPVEATPLSVPATVTGVLNRESGVEQSNSESGSSDTASPDFDLYRFSARAGQEWVIEVDAARSGSPVDSFVEVLTADGDRIERVLLQAMRDSYFTFRGKSADQTGDFRIFNWEEMTLNDYLYAGGEVVKLWMYPRGPDSGYNVYPGEGVRWGYFDTTPLSHALGEPCFIVEPHAPGTALIPNGLPVFTLYFENDDESRRSLGKDSRLFFTAPHDGEFLVKIKDVRGAQGPDFKYTLTIRPRNPDFRVTLLDQNLAVAPGSGKEFRVKAERRDGYEGPIRVDITNLPEGFTSTSPLIIEAGQLESMGVLMAAPDAPAPGGEGEQAEASMLTAFAEIDGREVTHSVGSFGKIQLAEGQQLRAKILPAEGGVQPLSESADAPMEVVIAPGETIMLKVAVERNGVEGEISFGKETSGRNLPHGLYVDNIGLNGLLLLSDQSEREFFITADHWVPEQTRLFHLTTSAGGGQATPPVILHIRHPDVGTRQAAR